MTDDDIAAYVASVTVTDEADTVTDGNKFVSMAIYETLSTVTEDSDPWSIGITSEDGDGEEVTVTMTWEYGSPPSGLLGTLLWLILLGGIAGGAYYYFVEMESAM